MKRNKLLFILLLIAVLGTGYYFKYHRHVTEGEPTATWVQASTVKKLALPLEAKAIGTLVARSIEITPEVAGQVKAVLFKDGSFVKKDTVLIQLDDAVYQAKYQSAKAQLAYSTNNFKRMVLLSKQGAIAKQAVDQAEADLKEKKAAAQESEVMLNKMKLIAAFDGVVGKSQVHPGQYVTVGQALVTLTDTQQLHIEYNVSEKYLPLIKLGQKVLIKTATYPGKTFEGTLAYISPTINPDNRSIALYAEISNHAGLLAAGMFVNVIASLGGEEKTLMIPAKSLVPVLDGEQVYKIVEGKAYATNVLIGKRNGENIQVLQGLEEGDRVITDGQLKVKNGMPVQLKNDRETL